ncbi:MAG: biopolymer transporter ExbD [Spirochaetes bacterium]|nr:biopolymer transporter ExbD [Spirochaetota bacterium]
MKIKVKRRKRIDVADSGALSDLAFLLIIFFIVIAVFNINKGFMLSLPQKNSSKIVNTSDIIKIFINNDGQIVYDDKIITHLELEDIVAQRLKIRPNMTFLLKIDPEAQYQNMVTVVDIVQKLDVDNFSFSMSKEP